MNSRILIVDDEADAEALFRQNFRREIRKGLYRFEFAQSGGAALDLLEAGEPKDFRLVLSDINMPGMTGAGLLDKMGKRWPSLPVMMITAYGDMGTERGVRERGAVGFLVKPLDLDHLRSELPGLIGDADR